VNLREDLGRSEQAVSELQNAINSIKPSPKNYQQWTEQHQLSGATALFDADPDDDKSPNYLEFAFGTNPTISRFHHKPSLKRTGDQLTLTYRQAKDVAGVRIHLAQSTNLKMWSDFTPSPDETRTAQFPTFTLNEITIPIQPLTQRYFEIRVTVQDASLDLGNSSNSAVHIP
jgi:hypothetical protein